MRLGGSRLWGTLLVLALLPAAAYFVLVGLIPLPDPRHNALFPLLLPLQLGPFLLAMALRGQPAGRGFRAYLLATGGLLLLLLLVALGLIPLITPASQGVFIRVYAAVAFSWVGVAGGVLGGWLKALRTATHEIAP